MRKLLSLVPFIIGLLLTQLTGCSDTSISHISYTPPPPGRLLVTVVDNTLETPIANAQVQVFDPDTGNVLSTLITGANGEAAQNYYQDNLQIKVATTGYATSPGQGIPALPIALIAGLTSQVTVRLQPLDTALQLGNITGQVLDTLSHPVAGALVTAEDGAGNTLIASHSGTDGHYTLFNVPAGSVVLRAWFAGLNFPAVAQALSDANGDGTIDPLNQNLDATSAANGSVSGHISFTATSGGIVDVTLLHPGSREVVPGLRDYNDNGGTYTVTLVPNGTYEVIASLENDGYVLDPDLSVTQGIPTVTINNNAITQDLKVTGSITLSSPAPTSFYAPLPQLSATPTFSWVSDSSYSSAGYFALELVDESSNTIWGGFDAATLAPLVTVPNVAPLSKLYDGPALTPGRLYQLRVYALKNDTVVPYYTVLSASETLDGLFRVATP